MLCVPVARAAVENVTIPVSFMTALLIFVAPSSKVIVPEGVPILAPFRPGRMVAVKVIDRPKTEGLVDDCRLMMVPFVASRIMARPSGAASAQYPLELGQSQEIGSTKSGMPSPLRSPAVTETGEYPVA